MVRRVASLLVFVVASVVAVVGQQQQQPPPAQQPQAPTPQFRGTADLVPVFATVVDVNGRLIPDLTKDDFEIRDEGLVRPLTLFSNEPQPISVVVMLDRSGSVMTSADVVQRGAVAFINKLRAGDRARVGSFGDLVQILPNEFTGNRFDLLSVLQGGLQADRNAASPVWSAVARSASALSQQTTRRVVLVFTDGHDAPAYRQERVKFNDLLRQVAEDDVMVYAIGVPGQITPRASSSFNPGRVMQAQTFSPPDPDLKKLAFESGGGFVDLDKEKRDIEGVFARIADELHAQYALGFTPGRLDGKVHDLEVRVKRPGTEVRARKTYVAR